MSTVYTDVIIAGFGGQGVMLIGNLLANAAMQSGFNVTYMPEYGPEMRGGTANCTVVIGQEDIGSPIIKQPLGLIIMNQPSLDKFLPTLQPGGLLVVNTSLVEAGSVDQSKARLVKVAANEISDELGNVKMANMVALGAWLKATGALPLNVMQEALNRVVSAHYAKLISANAKALEQGYNFA